MIDEYMRIVWTVLKRQYFLNNNNIEIIPLASSVALCSFTLKVSISSTSLSKTALRSYAWFNKVSIQDTDSDIIL